MPPGPSDGLSELISVECKNVGFGVPWFYHGGMGVGEGVGSVVFCAIAVDDAPVLEKAFLDGIKRKPFVAALQELGVNFLGLIAGRMGFEGIFDDIIAQIVRHVV